MNKALNKLDHTNDLQKLKLVGEESTIMGSSHQMAPVFFNRFPYLQKPGTWLNRHSLIVGIGLMFLLTWPIDLANAGVLPFSVPFAVYILLGYGFVIASVLMTWLTQGKDSVITLLKRFLIWRVDWKWYLVAFFLLPAIDLLGVLLYAVWSQTAPDFSSVYAYNIFGPSANLLLLAIPFFLFEMLTNGEEIGWRGYVLPRLQTKHSALMASLILGVIWSIWHLPKFVTNWDPIFFGLYGLHTMALAVLYTWLITYTHGSLLLVTLLHASSNTAGMMLPLGNTAVNLNAGPYPIIVLLTILIAVVVTAVAGPEQFSHKVKDRFAE